MQRNFELTLGEAASLAASSIEPFVGAFDGMLIEAVDALLITTQSKVVIVSCQFAVQCFDELSPWQMAVEPDPEFHLTLGLLQFLARCPLHHPQVAASVPSPV